MAMRRYADLFATVGEFTDADGRKAKRQLKVGVVMRDDTSGALSVKLDAVPVDPRWSGWLALRNFEAEGDQQEQE